MRGYHVMALPLPACDNRLRTVGYGSYPRVAAVTTIDAWPPRLLPMHDRRLGATYARARLPLAATATVAHTLLDATATAIANRFVGRTQRGRRRPLLLHDH